MNKPPKTHALYRSRKHSDRPARRSLFLKQLIDRHSRNSVGFYRRRNRRTTGTPHNDIADRRPIDTVRHDSELDLDDPEHL